MAFGYVILCRGISSARAEKVREILAAHGIDSRMRGEQPFRLHPFDEAALGGIGQTKQSLEVRYTVLVRKEDLDAAGQLIR